MDFVVSVILPPWHISTLPPRILPVRILGPWRSSNMAMGLPKASLAARRRLITRAWSACSPWDMFTLATSMPAWIRRVIISSEDEAGPRVHTILVLRILGALPYDFRSLQ